MLEPLEAGRYRGDIWYGYPAQPMLATHRWTGLTWQKLVKEKHMDFGEAIRQLKTGACITRAGWNGKDMHLYLVEHDPATRIRSYIMMKTAQDDLVPWLASQSDVLAEDWSLVE